MAIGANWLGALGKLISSLNPASMLRASETNNVSQAEALYQRGAQALLGQRYHEPVNCAKEANALEQILRRFTICWVVPSWNCSNLVWPNRRFPLVLRLGQAFRWFSRR